VKQTEILFGVTVFSLVILSVDLRASDNPQADTSRTGFDNRFAPGLVVPNTLSLPISGDLSYGAISESAPARGDADTQAYRLAKEVVNPVSWLMSVPFQANEDFGYGPSHNGYKFTLNIQPIIPISISKDWNLILRTIVPVVSQHDLFYVENVPKAAPINPQNRSQDGLSDTLQSFFFSPKNAGPFGVVWGMGPAFLYPTGTHPFLGTGTFSIGPTLVFLKQTRGWTAGALMNQLWSVVIEEDRKSVNQMFLQPFIAYTTKTHTNFILSSESTANWKSTSINGKWAVPLIFQVGQILKVGNQRLNLQVGGKFYVDSPRYGPDWGVRFQLTLLYPPARPPGGRERGRVPEVTIN